MRLHSVRFILPTFILFGGTDNSLAQTDYYRSTSFTWDTATLQWCTSPGGPYNTTAWNNGIELRAVFEGTAGTATLSTAITAASLQFNVQNWIVTGNTITMAGTSADAGKLTSGVASATINSALAGSIPLIKDGSFNLTLGGVNTFSNTLTIRNGYLRPSSNTAFGTVGAGTIVESGGTLDLALTTITTTFGDELFTISGNGTDGNGAIQNRSGSSAATGVRRIKLAADASIGGQTGSGNWQMSNSTAGFINTPNGTTVDLAGFTLTKVSTGSIIIRDGTITSGNVIVDGGVLGVARGTQVIGSGAITINANGTFGLSAQGGSSPTVTRPITSNGGAIASLETTSVTLGSNVAMTATTTFNAQNPGSLTVDGIISGDGGVRTTGTGVIRFNGDNSYKGLTSVETGSQLILGHANALGTTDAGTQVLNGGSLNLFSQTINSELISVAGSGRETEAALFGGTVNTTITLTSGASIGSITANGLITDGVSTFRLTAHAGSTVLARAAGNDYDGGTVIRLGTLYANNTTGSATGSGSISTTINMVGILGGTGRVTGSVTINASGAINPGLLNSIGTLRVANTVVFESSSSLQAHVAASGSSDRLILEGALSLMDFRTTGTKPTITVIRLAGFSTATSATYTIATLDDGDNIRLNTTIAVQDGQILGWYVHGTGNIAGEELGITPSGFTLTNGNTFLLMRNGNDLQLTFSPTPVPEPAQLFGIAFACLVLVEWIRRTKSASANKLRAGVEMHA